MFPTNQAIRYPHLVAYLNQIARDRLGFRMDATEKGLVGSFLALLLGFLCFIPALDAGRLAGPLICGLGMLGIGVALSVWHQRALLADGGLKRRREARGVAQRMLIMLQKRRLHRDMDPSSLLLLEECAKHWSRARVAFDSGVWTGTDVVPQYVSVRLDALESIEDSMEDVLLLYKQFVPEQVSNRSAMDFIDEAMQTYVLKQPDLRHPPIAFAPAREIAEKLRTLADEAERLNATASKEVPNRAVPNHSLDQTIFDIRQIRQAEEELRQDTRA